MNAGAQTNGFERQLRRIVALLLSLAGLAERAAGRSAPVRALVVWFIRHGEAVAHDYVEALTGRAICGPAAIEHPHSGPAEAMRLAAALRALAAALAAFVATASMQPAGTTCAMSVTVGKLHADVAPAVGRRDSS